MAGLLVAEGTQHRQQVCINFSDDDADSIFHEQRRIMVVETP